MQFWDMKITMGTFFLDFSWMGVFLLAAFVVRSRSRWLQKHLIPANLLGGVLGLMVGSQLLGWVDLPTERLGAYVYHLLALLFIALGLRSSRKNMTKSSLQTGLLFIMTYLVQGVIGILLTMAVMWLLMPDLFAGFGMLAPLGFGMNPGIAYTVGQSWEEAGFASGGVIGLTFSAIGFLAAYTTGIWAIRRGIRRGEATYIRPEDILPEALGDGVVDVGSAGAGVAGASVCVAGASSEGSADGIGAAGSESVATDANEGVATDALADAHRRAGRITTLPEVLESFTTHLGFIALTYVITYGLMQLGAWLLVSIGAESEVRTLWTFHFIFAAVTALLVRKVVDRVGFDQLIDDITMTRLSNFFMDFMIVASISAISVVVVGEYWLPLLLISGVVITATWFFIKRLCYQAFDHHKLEYFTSIYGDMTGTLQSALILLRVLDNDMRSPVSYHLVYGSGFSLLLGFPLLLLINAPVLYFSSVTKGFLLVTLVMAVYFVLLWIAWSYLSRRS